MTDRMRVAHLKDPEGNLVELQEWLLLTRLTRPPPPASGGMAARGLPWRGGGGRLPSWRHGRVRRADGGRRAPLVVGLESARSPGLAACERGGLSTAAVAVHDRRDRDQRSWSGQKADVRWLTCTASYADCGKDDGRESSPSATGNTVATVDCRARRRTGRTSPSPAR